MPFKDYDLGLEVGWGQVCEMVVRLMDVGTSLLLAFYPIFESHWLSLFISSVVLVKIILRQSLPEKITVMTGYRR